MTTSTAGPDLDAICALDAAATEGPWELGDSSTVYMSGQSLYYLRIKGKPGIRASLTASRGDAELIVAARNAVPALLAAFGRVAELEAALTEAQEAPGLGEDCSCEIDSSDCPGHHRCAPPACCQCTWCCADLSRCQNAPAPIPGGAPDEH